MRNNIIFDFDGTLVESRKRLYTLFCYLVPDSKLTFEQYWEMKRKGISHESMLKIVHEYNDFEIKAFQNLWMELIESDEYLEYDEPFEFTTDLLSSLHKRKYELILLTARQFPDKVNDQLMKFGWSPLFSKVLVTKQIETKKDVLVRTMVHEAALMMVGDTGNDILTANNLNIFSVGVLSGFHSKETLIKYNPKLIIPSAKQLLEYNFKKPY